VSVKSLVLSCHFHVQCESFAAVGVGCYRCPAGKRLFQGSTWCENIDECSENPSLCYYGTCRDLDEGYTCDCEPGYFGLSCRERRDAVSVVISSMAQLAIGACALVLFSESLYLPSFYIDCFTYFCVTSWSCDRTLDREVWVNCNILVWWIFHDTRLSHWPDLWSTLCFIKTIGLSCLVFEMWLWDGQWMDDRQWTSIGNHCMSSP